MNLTPHDIVWLNTALDGFIKVGNLELCKDKAQRTRNENAALQCKEKLANQAPGFTKDECRVAYIALSLVHDELAETPDSDPETPEVLARLNRLINAFKV